MERLRIIGVIAFVILIIFLVWKYLGKVWGILAAVLLGGGLIFGMSYSMGGDTGWQKLFGSAGPTPKNSGPKEPVIVQ